MARNESILAAPLPKPALYFGLPLAFVFLTTFFIILGFPYGALIDNLSVRVENATGMQLDVRDVDFGIGLLGPGFTFETVELRTTGGQRFSFDELYIRPAWSFSWLALAPAFYLDAVTPLGSARGVATLGTRRAWDGEIRDVDVEDLPLPDPLPGGLELMGGTLDAKGDLVYAGGALEGALTFDARDGALSHRAFPMGLPYEVLVGDVEIGGEDRIVIHSLELSSPMLDAKIDGRVGQADSIRDAELDLNMVFSNADPNTVLPMLKSAGAKMAADGSATMHIGGRLSSPKIR